MCIGLLVCVILHHSICLLSAAPLLHFPVMCTVNLELIIYCFTCQNFLSLCVCVCVYVCVCVLRGALSEKPDIVVGTPSRVLTHLVHKVRITHSLSLSFNIMIIPQKGGDVLDCSSMEVLVMDEADLLFSFGYEENIHSLLPHLPSIYQAILLSATLTDVRILPPSLSLSLSLSLSPSPSPSPSC